MGAGFLFITFCRDRQARLGIPFKNGDIIPNSEVAPVSRIDPHVFPSRFLTELCSVRNDTGLTVIPSPSGVPSANFRGGGEESQFNFGIRDNRRCAMIFNKRA
jgi:hypothetical protein